MSTIPDQFPLSLKAWPSKDDSAAALASLISRINVERNGFRNVTEESLLEEIKKNDDGIDVKDEDNSDDGEPVDEPDRLKELLTAREEMLGQLEQAHQASLIALDFISLLLSKDTPVQASLSISPALRETVALGTIGADKVTETKVTRAQKLDNAMVSKGWKLQSLNENADSILASAAKLEKEIEAETRYWQQVVEVSDKGWAVCRLPQEKFTLGVRFGFSESAPAFKNRSLAALRRNGDGSIYLDQGVTGSVPRRMRVRIQTNGEITGQFLPDAMVSDDAPLLSLILRARNAIFEDELWQELNREGRILANQGVRCLGEEITCIISPTQRLILDMVPSEDDQTQDGISYHDDDTTAHMIYLSLHLLLSYAHRQIYRRRAQPQPPISSRPIPIPQYNLLRAIVARVQYHAVTSKLSEAISDVFARLQTETNANQLWSFESEVADTPAPPTSKPHAERLIERVISHLEGKFILPLTQTPEQRLIIRFRTTLYPLDTWYQISATGPIAEAFKPPSNPLSVDEVIEYILWAAGSIKIGNGQ